MRPVPSRTLRWFAAARATAVKRCCLRRHQRAVERRVAAVGVVRIMPVLYSLVITTTASTAMVDAGPAMTPVRLILGRVGLAEAGHCTIEDVIAPVPMATAIATSSSPAVLDHGRAACVHSACSASGNRAVTTRSVARSGDQVLRCPRTSEAEHSSCTAGLITSRPARQVDSPGQRDNGPGGQHREPGPWRQRIAAVVQQNCAWLTCG